jgi:hypothetical protein
MSTSNRFWAAALVALAFAVPALAEDAPGGEGTYVPRTFGNSVTADPNAPAAAPLPDFTFKYN